MKRLLIAVMCCICCCLILSSCGAQKIDVFDAVSLSVPTNQIYKFSWFVLDNDKTGCYQSEISGYGEVELTVDISKIDYDKSNTDITEFLESIDFVLTDGVFEPGKGNLRNGDNVTVSISYSKSRAEELGIKIPKTEHNLSVSYQEIVRDKSEITKEDLDEIYFKLKSYVQGYANFITDIYYAYYLDNSGEQYLAIVVVEDNCSDGSTGFGVREFLIDPDNNELVAHYSNYSRFSSYPNADKVKRVLGTGRRKLISFEFVEHSNDPTRTNSWSD